MATSSNAENNVEDEIAEIGALTDNFRSELEEKFGLLYEHGQPRNDLDKTQKQELMGLCKVLEGLKLSIDNFQKDSSKVCRDDISEMTSVEMREIKGRKNMLPSLCSFRQKIRESGYTSSDMKSLPSTPGNSSNRLSAVDADNDPEERATFNLKSTCTSLDSFGESTADDKPELSADDISTVSIHLVPTDPKTDLTALRAEIRKISRSTMKSDNIEVNVVPPDSVISIPSHHSYPYDQVPSSARTSRQISSSSAVLNAIRNRLPSSNDSILSAMWQMSTKTPEEHTDSSDDQSSRLVSSSDSEVSLIRYRLLLITSETQTDAVHLLDRKSVETQTN